MKYLSGTAAAAKLNLPYLIQRVIRQGGPGAWRQAFQILRLRSSGSGLSAEEYYTYGLWRKDIDPDFIRQYLPGSQFEAFNQAFAMPGLGLNIEDIEDKVATETILRAKGIATSQTLAAVGASPAAAHVQHLANAADIRAFLSNPAHLPVFGKPRDDSFARGAVAITAVSADGQTITFLNGVDAPLADLADEIVADWPGGYLFQPFYQCHGDLRRHVGAAMASVRIVTLRTDAGVAPYYAVLRIPSRTAMHDGDSVNTRIWGLIDPASGAVVKLRNLRDPLTPDLTHWLDGETPLLGAVLPHWPAAMAAVLRAHDSFPAFGILGWDVFLTEAGALINEANRNPGHVYQAAAARGLKNPDLMPVCERALAHARRVNRT